MPAYQLIEDVKELERLSALLARNIAKKKVATQTRTIGFPGPAEDISRKVVFLGKRGPRMIWWAHSPESNEVNNFIGHGDPQDANVLSIDLQFNVPLKKFSRHKGGAFVRDVESGQIVLAHRGIVTKGYARIGIKALIEEAQVAMSKVISSKGSEYVFLVAALSSSTLIDDIEHFSNEIRRAANVIAEARKPPVRGGNNGKPGGKAAGGPKKGLGSEVNDLDEQIGDYFAEFVGRHKVGPRGQVIVTVRHGHVVASLKDALEGLGNVQKSRAIDLALRGKHRSYLFEVKTSIDSTSLYTAVGQLQLHGQALTKLLNGHPLRRVLVIPGAPPPRIQQALQQELGIHILTYTWGPRNSVRLDDAQLAAILGR